MMYLNINWYTEKRKKILSPKCFPTGGQDFPFPRSLSLPTLLSLCSFCPAPFSEFWRNWLLTGFGKMVLNGFSKVFIFPGPRIHKLSFRIFFKYWNITYYCGTFIRIVQWHLCSHSHLSIHHPLIIWPKCQSYSY